MSNELNGVKVLLVDDERDLLDLIAENLESFGAIVFKVEDGVQALELIEKTDLDFIFCDLKLPRLSGTELLKKLKDNGVHLPNFYFFSGYPEKTDSELRKLGAQGFLNKPFEIEDIVNIVKNNQSSSD